MWAKQKGFTIVELLIVIVVIAILASITVVAYNGISTRARDSQTDTSLSHIKKGLEMYRGDNGEFPNACGTDNAGCAVSTLGTHLVPTYISVLPSTTPFGGYVRGAPSTQSYGILVNYSGKPVCKTGVNVAAGWWGTGVPIC